MMKYVSLAKNLKPDNTIDGDDLTRGTAKHLFEQDAKQFEARASRSRETLLAAKRRGRQVKDEKLVVRQNVGDKTVTVGSEEKIYTNNTDCGLFASIITAYNKHWKLRMSPEDWWFVVARRVAIAVDQNSKKEAVRKMFVEHEGKSVVVADYRI
jgi:hypothetical protein